ncbi:MAG: GDCCVxC domain-containing (seleno)protein [Gemmatimonadota bacterium]
MQLQSILTCPHCGFAESLPMPVNACQFFHECAGCRVLLRPEAGDCCVFCSFGTVVCPPMHGIGSGNSDGKACCTRRPASA